jgi:hypothetical protein
LNKKLRFKYERIIKLLEDDQFIVSNHARIRMFKRNISTDEIKATILTGEIIEEYENDDPCPSALILGYSGNASYHIVVALCIDHIRIITVYKPDENLWIENRFRK